MLKNVPGIGNGASTRHANAPSRNATWGRVVGRETSRARLPSRAAAASMIRGSAIRWRANRGSTPNVAPMAPPSQSSPQWYHIWVGRPGIDANPAGEAHDSTPVVIRSRPRME